MKRLLCIVSSMDRGGAETFLMKLYRKFDREKYQMDFAVNKTGVYDDEIRKMGGKIYYVPLKSKNPLKSFFTIKKIVKEKKYKYVLRTSQQSLATLDLLAAKFGGAKNLIYRSSNAGIVGKGKVINKLFSFLPMIIPNVKIAPSTEAAEFVFGKKSLKKGKVLILKNALDYDLFKFSIETRKKIRKELNLDDKYIIGHVGRFNMQKNHDFLIDIFNEIYRENKNAHLLLIGKGELEENIRSKITTLNLEKNVTIMDPISNINEYYMAMDILLFPSLFEGMPNVLIEAQASGLQCIVSDKVTKEANITSTIKFVSLECDSKFWASETINNMNYIRKDYKDKFISNKYLIDEIVKQYIDNIFN